MAALKEIKQRLNSVKSTQKITSAMMMISSSKLRKAQKVIISLYPYKQKLSSLLETFISSERDYISPYAVKRSIHRVAILAFSSNNSLAGKFNDDVIDELGKTINAYRSLGNAHIYIYAIGDKIASSARRMGMTLKGDFSAISETPSYEEAQKIAEELMKLFTDHKIDKVELLYHHFKSKSAQVVVHEDFLPITLKEETKTSKNKLDYIVEPDAETVLNELIPKVLKLKLYTAHADSVVSEHAARMVAMQIATDNASNLTSELTLQYNKMRQQSITNELLDMIGGSFEQQ